MVTLAYYLTKKVHGSLQLFVAYKASEYMCVSHDMCNVQKSSNTIVKLCYYKDVVILWIYPMLGMCETIEQSLVTSLMPFP